MKLSSAIAAATANVLSCWIFPFIILDCNQGPKGRFKLELLFLVIFIKQIILQYLIQFFSLHVQKANQREGQRQKIEKQTFKLAQHEGQRFNPNYKNFFSRKKSIKSVKHNSRALYNHIKIVKKKKGKLRKDKRPVSYTILISQHYCVSTVTLF